MISATLGKFLAAAGKLKAYLSFRMDNLLPGLRLSFPIFTWARHWLFINTGTAIMVTTDKIQVFMYKV
jgi:hypothetical protein